MFHRNKNIHIFKFVLDFFKDRKDFILQKNNEGNNILHKLLRYGDIAGMNPLSTINILQLLFGCPELFYEKNNSGYTILHYGIFINTPLILAKYIFDNVDPNIFFEKANMGDTIFHHMFWYCDNKEFYEFVFEKFKDEPYMFLQKTNDGSDIIGCFNKGVEKSRETKNYVLEYVKKNFQL